MSSEMISGPDLGGGYLHQLTRDQDADRTTFTYHAQEGGQDAGGPPKGPLEPLGYIHPPSPCQFGGPRCWHRRFLLPVGAAAKVRLAYNRSRFVLEAMLDQQYGGLARPFAATIEEVVRRLREPLARAGVRWYIGGSASVKLLGGDVEPERLDLGTTRDGVDRIGELLGDLLIEPVGPTDWPRTGLVHAARAFVGTFRNGMRTEWAVPLERSNLPAFGEWTGPPGIARTLDVAYAGGVVQASRPEYALVRSAEKSRGPPSAPIVTLVRRLGPDVELLDALLARSSLASEVRAELVRAVGP